MKMFFEGKKRRVEDNINKVIENSAINEDALFVRAEFDPNAGEKTGYSNYSYWRSTFRAFRHNRLAMVMASILVILVLFTIIQPLLPGQYDALTGQTNPLNENKLLSAKPPSLSTVYMSVPKGTLLNAVKVNDDWYGVRNTLTTIKNDPLSRNPIKFSVLEYGEEWCTIRYDIDYSGEYDILNDGKLGYIKRTAVNGEAIKFETNAKRLPAPMPEDLNDTPYTTYSWQEIAIYAEPEDISQSGDYLYVESEYIDLNEDGSAVTNADVDLRDYPSKMPFILGTNSAGQDLWARIWSGTRTSLWIGFVVAIFEVLIGIIVGIIWGYVRALDRIITEIYNVIDNIPTTIILVLVSYIMRPSISTLIFAMSLTRWLGMARFIRNQIIIIRDRDYNLASRCLGTEPSRIMIKNLLPYLVSVIMLRMALAIPNAIGSEVFITYIGLGLSVSTPSLGNLIIEGKSLITVPGQQYQLIYSSLVLSIITISFYIIGNAFADAADPKNHV